MPRQTKMQTKARSIVYDEIQDITEWDYIIFW